MLAVDENYRALMRIELTPMISRIHRDELCADRVQRLGVLQRAAHDQRIVHAVAVVGEHSHPRRRVGHRTEFGQLLTTQANGHRTDRMHIGCSLKDPHIDYARMAQDYGMYAEGPISDPKDLAGAYKRALDRVKGGEPALVDVITQPR